MPTTPTGPPTVGLSSLSIRDFRGIEQLDLDFRGPDGLPNRLVVIAGPNGSGKTSVIEAALIAAGGCKSAVGPHGKQAIRRGAADYQINGVFERDGSKFETNDSSRESSPELFPPIPYWYFSSWRAPRLVGPVNVTVGRPGRQPSKNDRNRLRNIKSQLANAAAVERFGEQERPLLKKYSTWIEEINAAWSEFDLLDGCRFAVELTDDADSDQGAFDVYYRSPDRPRLEVDLLSSGQLEIFLFLSALVLNNDREGIIFIDEPELHLDPQWHRPILRSLMRLQPRVQFILATHSPEIYDGARTFERHFLVAEDDPRAHLWSNVRGVETGA